MPEHHSLETSPGPQEWACTKSGADTRLAPSLATDYGDLIPCQRCLEELSPTLSALQVGLTQGLMGFLS